MQQTLSIAVLAGVGGMLGWGFADFFAKKTIDAIGDMVSLVWAHVFGTIAFLIVPACQLAFGGSISLPDTGQGWALLVFFGALQAAVYLLVYRGFGKGQLGVLNPVFSSFSGLTALLSILVFGEAVSGGQLFALCVIFAGIMVINLDFRALRMRQLRLLHVPGLLEVGIATILAALWTLGWDKFIDGKDWSSYAVLMYAFMTVTILVIARARGVALAVRRGDVWKFLVLIGICETVAYWAISLGYSTTPHTSVVAVLSGAFALPTIILARVFLKEQIPLFQTVGSGMIVCGIVLLPAL